MGVLLKAVVAHLNTKSLLKVVIPPEMPEAGMPTVLSLCEDCLGALSLAP